MAVIVVFNPRAKEDPESARTKYNDAIQENVYEYNMKDLWESKILEKHYIMKTYQAR